MPYETGFVGKPGTFRATKVHLFRDGKAMCGYRPSPTWQFQWCAHGIKFDYLECPRCLEHARKHYLKLAGLAGEARGKLAFTTGVAS